MTVSAPLRVIFMGTPDFAVPALRAIQAAGHDIISVYCQPPKPSGRGHHVQKTAIHLCAEEIGLTVETPRSLKDSAVQEKLRNLCPDIIVVAAYGLLLPQAVLDIPRLGCLNIHGSLLPRWRGAAPIHRALLAGDAITGITIMQMEAGLDTGAMALKDFLPITPHSTTTSLHDELSAMGAKLILQALESAAKGALHFEKQNEADACYAAKLTKDEGKIDWRDNASIIHRKIRALNPWPSCFFDFNGEAIKIIDAEPISFHAPSQTEGTLLDEAFTIQCGSNTALRLKTVQRSGKKAADAPSVLRGMRLEIGFRFS